MIYSYYLIYLDLNFNVIFFYVEKLKVVKVYVKICCVIGC